METQLWKMGWKKCGPMLTLQHVCYSLLFRVLRWLFLGLCVGEVIRMRVRGDYAAQTVFPWLLAAFVRGLCVVCAFRCGRWRWDLGSVALCSGTLSVGAGAVAFVSEMVVLGSGVVVVVDCGAAIGVNGRRVGGRACWHRSRNGSGKGAGAGCEASDLRISQF